MLTVSDAYSITQQHLLSLPTETISLTDALGRVLRSAIYADRDFPPFDRVAMDGICIRFADYEAGQREFRVAGTQFAGQPQQTLAEPNTCLEVMTGAMLPIGADTVVRYEDIQIQDGAATILIDSVEAEQQIHALATDRQTGDELLPIGTRLGPSELAVAASVGQTILTVTKLPRVALISTGDELVDVAETPLPYQIRRSNTYMLQAALRSLGINATLHHLPDNQDVLTKQIATLLRKNDVLILNGGVSAGKADFVPDVLAELGVKKQFHKIEQRPGKPLWFGTKANKAVFALPGNPVSTVLCTYRYVLPYLRASLGMTSSPIWYAQLAQAITFKPNLTYFLPIQLSSKSDGRLLAYPLPGSGSADFTNLTAAHAFIELPADRTVFGLGEAYPIWPIRSV